MNDMRLIREQRKVINHFANDCIDKLEQVMLKQTTPYDAVQIAVCMRVIRETLCEWRCDKI